MIRNRLIAVIFLGTGLFISAAAFAQESPKQAPSLDDYLREPEVRAVSMSPDGTKLAIIKRIAEEDYRLYVMDLQQDNKIISAIEEPRKKKFTNVRWLNNERVGVTLTGDGDFYGFEFEFDRMVALDVQGSDTVGLMEDRKELRMNITLARVVSVLPNDTEHILLLGYNRGLNIYKVNIYTGTSEIVTKGANHTIAYSVNSKGEAGLRYDYFRNTGRLYVYAYNEELDIWEKVSRIRRSDDKEELLSHIAGFVGEDKVMMLDRKDEDEYYKLYHYDIREKDYVDVAHELEGHDVTDIRVESYSGKVIGLEYITDRPQHVYFDDAIETVQNHLESRLPNGQVDIRSISNDRRRYLLFSSEPWHRGSYYLYDDTDKSLTKVIDVAAPASGFRTTAVDVIRYGSVDKKLMDGFLTFPAGDETKICPSLCSPTVGRMPVTGYSMTSLFSSGRRADTLYSNPIFAARPATAVLLKRPGIMSMVDS